MLNNKCLCFLKNTISVDCNWLSQHFKSLSSDEKSSLTKYINNLIDIQGRVSENKVDAINNFFNDFRKTDQGDFYDILDAWRHAFVLFSLDGLKSLYLQKESVSFYPVIILKEELKPNDRQSLPNIVDIYRGCNVYEYKSENYGQAWTTCKKTASTFAYMHCSDYEEARFNKADRCILKAKIKNKHILYSDQKCHEKEIVVRSEKLISVSKIS